MENKDASVAAKLVRLVAEYPCAGEGDQKFELQMPEQISKKSYDVIVQHIEFRRRCMNQGFNNLLELLKMTWEARQSLEGPAEE